VSLRHVGLVTAVLLLLGWVAQAAAGTVAVISRFTITRDGQPFFDDTFSGERASLAVPRPAGGQPTEYSVIGAVPDGSAVNGKLSLNSANGAQNATADGQGRLITAVRLMTNADPQNVTAGLKTGHTFSMSALFDVVVPGGPVEGYGIRFGDGADSRNPAHVVSLFVFRNKANGMVVRFLHQDFEARKQYVIEDPPINSTAGDQILLVLSRASLKSSHVTAQFQFMRNGAPVAAPVALADGAPVFGGGQRNWTRAEFFVFEQTELSAK
jgi:hypothetical protein